MAKNLSKEDKLKLNRLKKQITAMVREDNAPKLKETDKIYLLSDFVDRSLAVLEFSSLVGQHVAVEYDLKSPTVFYSVVQEYFGSQADRDFVATHSYNPVRNVININMSRCKNKPLGCLLGDFICHELKHKLQADVSGVIDPTYYQIYKASAQEDVNALWAADEAEREAEKFGFLYSFKLLGGSCVLSRRTISAFSDNLNFAQKSFRFIRKGKKRFKKIEQTFKYFPRVISEKDILKQTEMYEYFKNNSNVLTLEVMGMHFQLPLREIKKIVLNSKTEQDYAEGFLCELEKRKPINVKNLPKSDIMLPNNGYVLSLYHFMSYLKEYKNCVYSTEDLKKEEDLTNLIRAAFYASFDDRLKEKKKKAQNALKKAGKTKEEVDDNTPQTLTFSKQDLLDMKAYLSTSSAREYNLFNSYENAKSLLDYVKLKRVIKMQEAFVAADEITM